MSILNLSNAPEFAPVVPIEVAKILSNPETGHNLFGNYHLLLAHDVVKHPNDYANLYGSPMMYKIMDNSVIELGSSVDGAMLLEACAIVNANVLALPDVLMDNSGTVHAAAEALSKWNLPNNIVPMIIPQGQSPADWAACLKELVRIMDFAKRKFIVGIPKNYREKLGWSRCLAIQQVRLIAGRDTMVHLLGFSDDFFDDLYSASVNRDIVMGIDSAAPIWLGLRGYDMDQNMCTPNGQKRDNFWDEPYTRGGNHKCMIENIALVHNALMAYGPGRFPAYYDQQPSAKA